MCARDSNTARGLTTPRADFSLTLPKGEKQNSSGPVRAISSAAQRASTAFPLGSPAIYSARGRNGASQENAKGPCKVSSTSSHQQGAVTMMRTCMKNDCAAQKAKVHPFRWHS